MTALLQRSDVMVSKRAAVLAGMAVPARMFSVALCRRVALLE
jgi:hypothetical protein